MPGAPSFSYCKLKSIYVYISCRLPRSFPLHTTTISIGIRPNPRQKWRASRFYKLKMQKVKKDQTAANRMKNRRKKKNRPFPFKNRKRNRNRNKNDGGSSDSRSFVNRDSSQLPLSDGGCRCQYPGEVITPDQVYRYGGNGSSYRGGKGKGGRNFRFLTGVENGNGDYADRNRRGGSKGDSSSNYRSGSGGGSGECIYLRSDAICRGVSYICEQDAKRLKIGRASSAVVVGQDVGEDDSNDSKHGARNLEGDDFLPSEAFGSDESVRALKSSKGSKSGRGYRSFRTGKGKGGKVINVVSSLRTKPYRQVGQKRYVIMPATSELCRRSDPCDYGGGGGGGTSLRSGSTFSKGYPVTPSPTPYCDTPTRRPTLAPTPPCEVDVSCLLCIMPFYMYWNSSPP